MLVSPAPLFPDYIRLHARWRGDADAVIAPDGRLTWSELDQRLDRIAAGLAAMGLKAGDRIGVLASNHLATVEIMLGIMRAGMVVAPLNPAVTDEAIRAMLDDAGVAALFATDDQAPRLDLYPLPEDRRLVANAVHPRPGWRDYAVWRNDASGEPGQRLNPSAACNIIYSSGTTGLPKGITHDLGGRTEWARDVALTLRYHGRARSLVCTGLYSNITWAAMLSTVIVGGALVVHAHFDAEQVLAALRDGDITHLAMVPVLYQRLLEHPSFSPEAFRSVETLMCVGAALPIPVKSRLLAAAPGRLIELWGLTEGLLTALDPHEAADHIASVGKPLPGSDILLIDDDGRPSKPGDPGEIVGRSRYLMTGYWNRPDATAQTLWTDEDGEVWLRTGDVGRLDAAGFLQIVDRKKDMIVSGGQNVYPADIEAVLLDHPDVSECAVIGVPSERWGEAPLALVVLRNAQASPETLLDWVNGRVGKQQRLSAVEVRPALPRNPAGKILKRELREPYWRQA